MCLEAILIPKRRKDIMDKPRNVAVYMRVARAPRVWIYCRVAAPDAFALRTQQEELMAFAKENHY